MTVEGRAVEAARVFITYSHVDEPWKVRLQKHLKAAKVTSWDDRQIDAGDKWYNEIMAAMEAADVAVCLISADYLASDFVTKEEVPFLIEKRQKVGMVLIPVLLHHCPWKRHKWIGDTQMLPRDAKSVAEDCKGTEESVFAAVADRVVVALDAKRAPFDDVMSPFALPSLVEVAPHTPGLRDVFEDVTRLPVTGAELFGRLEELELLDKAWESQDTHIISFVAWGGVGKSTLVNKWRERMATDGYRGAKRVFGWSFYSQGTGDRAGSADQFMSAALKWFGDPNPDEGSPWSKAERLGALVRKQRTLLILDGMEPLQSDVSHPKGQIKDPALQTLLDELARENPGLCVITTRVWIPELNEYKDTTKQLNLELISPQAGRSLLRVRNVQGTDAELEAAVSAFGNHALAINLVAEYLRDIPGHPISEAAKIPDLDIPVEKGRHPRRMMAAFAKRFGDGPEVELLRVLGLFDRPAKPGELAALFAPPAIAGLTTHLSKASEPSRSATIERLRRYRLIARHEKHDRDELDAHPLVREHFGDELSREFPEAWKAGHGRLYEYLTSEGVAPYQPDTVEEMAPLYQAVMHGCKAGRHQEALDTVYFARIRRGNEGFSIHKLGAFGSDLAVLAGFFDEAWSDPVSAFGEADRAGILASAGFALRALGRLTEAVEPMRAALARTMDSDDPDWRNGAIRAGNLSELLLTLGRVEEAIEAAERSVEYADKSRDEFQRMGNRTAQAGALHQAGRLDEARRIFEEAERMQKGLQPEYPLLYSLQGYRYCDLLLEQGQCNEVLKRAKTTTEWTKQGGGHLLTISFDHLSMGRAEMMAALVEQTKDFGPARSALNEAVEWLRKAGTQHHVPRGLLARAELYRHTEEWEKARRDLEEAMRMAVRGGMRLHECDGHLEYARMYLAEEKATKPRSHEATKGEERNAKSENRTKETPLGPPLVRGEVDTAQEQGHAGPHPNPLPAGEGVVAKAREHWEKARRIVEETGYHRRDKDVEEIGRELERVKG